ncbi:SDR family NAD(P)-dependent oxidoreductase [Agrobacterium rhizogenes]|uniref:SDR family NAD(P)-dependent oxidoreductase n=1 Tax=Rhizobium rhizogenes TaxID=359 RepID=UPI0005699184|nr:SDR family NAD(P)-dependent oxidoreductase [Rhizobium rhizogenes]NTF82180.1 SDR family NAD(P)-dependent oxidoreductase [Rhizobium rhizogenes]NTH78198.1 SDR family NAD(P)-dependent oxidoreductase [Rhizobium rhizogenes]NTH84206.1 SDR family NAD(P)-dependent oxidoreductase [Rhizobium rhizogenes]NTI75608.1 SDR family NAD(P)-dependent oxidoreductase [Rhizobium rhizogenes]
MNMSNKTILITGSTDGVGRRVAERLAAAGGKVLVHGRDQARAKSLLAGIHDAGGKAVFYPADLSSLDETRALADAIERDHDRLDILVNNAGIGTGGGNAGRQVSRDGHELRFAVNYLAGFLLTRRLLPLLKASGPARIVNVSSAGQQSIDFSDVMLTRGYSGVRAYCQSKLAQIMFTFDLAEELAGSNIIANCLHPATYMNTTMVRQAGVAPMSTVDQGADAILNLAVGADLEGYSGLYYNGQHPSRANAQAYDTTARQRLRLLSQNLAGLS